ncbi:MAG: ROK family protein, partial [Thermoplasmata archaeon]|nr:ROK family protein [Thermoplasmata archaeon]
MTANSAIKIRPIKVVMQNLLLVKPKVAPPLDMSFRPAVLANHLFLDDVARSGKGVPLRIALERSSGAISVFETEVFPENHERFATNLMYVERTVKTLLWQRGGWRIVVGGPAALGEHIRSVYSPAGDRAFDAELMAEIYDCPFTVEIAAQESVPNAREETKSLRKHLDGCRIGFDLGASDRKVVALIEGQEVFSDETVWDPKNQADPQYHYDGITDSLKRAAAHMPRVDAIGGSAAGIYVDNRVVMASLFRGVPDKLFEERARDIFLEIRHQWNDVPLVVINDGEAAALAGSLSL